MTGFDQKYDSEYYDGKYKEIVTYHNHYSQSPYFPLWKIIINWIHKIKKPKILEVGCGMGQLAHYLYDNKYTDYVGFDFSKYAISRARRFKQKVFEGNAYDAKNYNYDYSVVICTEVFEHLEHDRKAIENIKNGAVVLFSVPTFGGAGHARRFPNDESIKRRYGDMLDIKEIKPIFKKDGTPKWYICKAIKI